MANGAERFDIVFDVYKVNSPKRETRESRGKGEGVRILIKKNTTVFRDFKQVMMAITKNKAELFTLIADTLVETFKECSETVVMTRLQNAVKTTPTKIYVNPKNLNFGPILVDLCGFRTGGQNGGKLPG